MLCVNKVGNFVFQSFTALVQQAWPKMFTLSACTHFLFPRIFQGVNTDKLTTFVNTINGKDGSR